MKTKSSSASTELALWIRILHPDGRLPLEVAREILRHSFPGGDKKRMHDLSSKARAGTLSAEEDDEMDAYERAGALLSILKSKARQVLQAKSEDN